MKQGTYHDYLFFSRLALRSAVLAVVLAVMVIRPAFAADGLPPPQAIYTAPTNTIIRGVQGNGGTVLKVTPEQINMSRDVPQYRNARYYGGTAGGIMHGTKDITTILTDTHGATARGQITTTTRMPATSTMAQGLGAIMVADLANSHLNNLTAQGTADRFVRALEHGDLLDAGVAVAQLADITGLGGNIYRHLSAQDIAPINDMMQQRAKTVYDQYQQTRADRVDPANYAAYSVLTVREWGAACKCEIVQAITRTYLVKTADIKVPGFNPNQEVTLVQAVNDSRSWPYVVGGVSIIPDLPIGWVGARNWINITTKPSTADDIAAHNAQMAPKLSDVIPAEAEIVALLTQLLNDTNRNNTNLINAIHAAGIANADNTTTTVDNGGTAQTTFLTAPYTPQGSDQAQQTQFTINKDGSVTATTIPRPDLAANTSQAPTRAPVGQVTTTPSTVPAKETATPEAPDICANNPNSLMCAPIGNADYEDPIIPEQSINLDFQPANTFSTDGVCPKPLSFSVMNTTHAIEYAPMCDFARSARPMLILIGMFISMGMAYAAVKEL